MAALSSSLRLLRDKGAKIKSLTAAPLSVEMEFIFSQSHVLITLNIFIQIRPELLSRPADA